MFVDRWISDPRIARRTGVKKYLSQTNHYIVPTKESKGKYRKGVPQGIDLRRQSADRGTIEPNDQQSPVGIDCLTTFTLWHLIILDWSRLTKT